MTTVAGNTLVPSYAYEIINLKVKGLGSPPLHLIYSDTIYLNGLFVI